MGWHWHGATKGGLAHQLKACFSYYFHTAKKKAPNVSAKCLISLPYLVGDASFELATPAV